MKTFPSRALPLLTLVAALCTAAGSATAQEAGSREREALRRAQAALNDARRQVAALEAERAAWLREKAQLAADSEAGRKQAAAAQARAQQALASARTEQERLRDEAAAQAKASAEAAAARDRAAQAEMAKLQQELAQRKQTVASVTGLLERATQALADAEGKNRQLHALAVQAVERYRSKTPMETALQGDPLFGLTQVRIENVADALRAQMDAQRVVR